MKIIGIIGSEGIGKDTMADYLVKNHGFVKYNMAQPIKEIAKIMFGWSDELMNSREKDNIDPESGIVPRDFFKWFGTHITQYQIYQDLPGLKMPKPREMWVECMRRFVESSSSPVVIPDIRFIHEAKVVKELGGHLIHLSGNTPDLSSSQYEILELIDPKNGWLSSSLINPRISMDDFHYRISEWIKQNTSFIKNTEVSECMRHLMQDNSNLSLYI